MKFNESKRFKEKILLTEILPFEVPFCFSNRHFYKLVKSLKIGFDEKGKLYYDLQSKLFRRIQKEIFDGDLKEAKEAVDQTLKILLNASRDNPDSTIPYSYRIIHKDIDFRELTVIHPRNQIRVMEFINKFSKLIIYYSQSSFFSIRSASGIMPDSHAIETDQKGSFKEQYFELDTYFKYRFKNVFRFYESYVYQRAESKFNYLFKFDISKCFDSVYTHSIAWAIHNKEAVKRNLKKSNDTFAGQFDNLMQKMAYNETNGIVIGPEFSRVFAELILQRIDRDVYIEMEKAAKHKVDYEIYRYVDDYFLFYNDPCKKESILEKYELKLREYKMSLNHAKSELLERPVITLRTIYNIKIGDLLKDFGDAVFALKAVIKDDEQQEDSSDSAEIDWKEMGKQFSLMKKATDASKTKTHFKAIVKETEQDLKDILPYTLGLLTNRVDSYTKLLKKHIIKPLSQVSTHNSADLEDIFDNCIQTLANLIDISFFVYSMAPRVNSTIKLCRIITIVASLLNDARSPFKDRKHRVYKLVFDRVSDVMRFNKSHKNKEYAKLESLYLLVALKQLGKNYWIPEETLQEYVGLEKDEPKQDTLDYFQIIVILFYITKKKRYEKTREKIIKIANKRLQINDLKINKMKAESTMLLFDLLACPYLKSDEKKDIANSFGIQQEQHIEIQKVITFMNYWFTKWDHFNIKAELDAKKSSQVY